MKFSERQTRVFRFDIVGNCIYFLLNKKRVVYVGKSSFLCGRIATHAVSEYGLKKEFDEVVFFECKKEKSSFIERRFIKKYMPIYNVAGTGRAYGSYKQDLIMKNK